MKKIKFMKNKKRTESNQAENKHQGTNDINSAQDDLERDDNVIQVRRTMGKKAKVIFAMCALFIVLALVVATYSYNKIKTYKGFNQISVKETSGDNLADYVVFADNVLKVTKDGASYIDQDGVVRWDVGYAMKMPKAQVCGDYAVVADLNGRDVYVFNTEGEVSRQSLNYDIADVDVAQQGVYCVIVLGEDCNYIRSYDKDGGVIYEVKASIDEMGYPMDMDISEDGNKMAVSYVRMEGTQVSTVLATYNFGSVGQNENADRMMGDYTIEGEVCPTVKFVDNDTIVCFGDSEIRIYTMPEKPSEKAVIDLEDREIQGVFYNSSYLGYVTLAGGDDTAKYKLYIYDTNGNLKSVADVDKTYESIYATENEIIIVGDMDCSIFRFNGSKKFEYSFTSKLVNVVPDSAKEEYMLIFENETQTIALTNN